MTWEETILKENEVPLVEEVPLIAHERETGYKAVVDKTTMDTICVVPMKYQLVQNQLVLREVQKLKNYVIKKIELTKKGTTLMIEMTEREPKKIELFPEDYLECGVRVFNDYSKNAGLSIQSFGVRLACTNGVVAPKFGEKIPIKAFGTEEFAKEMEVVINSAFEAWTNEKTSAIFKHAVDTTVSVKDILEDHSFLPKKHMEEIIKSLKDRETLYNIWNAYTQVITHKVSQNKKDIDIIYLQKRANQILTIEVET